MVERVRNMRALSGVAAVVAVGALLAGCSSAATEPPGLNASESPTATATPTADPDAADVAAIKTVHDAFRAAKLSTENGPEVDPSAFYGIASDEIITNQVDRVAGFVKMGIHRVGAPVIGEPVITVKGDAARLEVCVNDDTWNAVGADGKLITTAYGSSPNLLDLAKTDGNWQVSHVPPDTEGTIKC